VAGVSRPPFDLGGGGLLRPYRIDDLDAMWPVVQEERDRLAVWMPWIETTRTKDDERAWLEHVLGGGLHETAFGIWVEGEFAGGMGLEADPFRIVAEIGYWIRSRHEGRGFVTRGCAALIDHAFDDIGVHRIVIRAGVDNHRSRAIPERLGFTYEGVHREEGRGSEGFHDLVVYGLLDREWRSRR
jgi:ribosomal-protein-serine acetyltransferase